MLRDIEHLHCDQRNEPLLWNSRVLHILAPLLAHLFVIRIRPDLGLLRGGVSVAVIVIGILAKPELVEEGAMSERIATVRRAVTSVPRRSLAGGTAVWKDWAGVDSCPLSWRGREDPSSRGHSCRRVTLAAAHTSWSAAAAVPSMPGGKRRRA